MFLADDGTMKKEATYFETSDAAEETYRSEFGKGETDEEYEHERESQETHRRGYSPKGESHTHASKERGWGNDKERPT
jgi:hypothetical protein